MATLKYKEIEKLSKTERNKKLKELKLELVKSKVNVSKTGSAKVKAIKKIIARILTLNNLENKQGVEEK
ncbi:50S ribosomal protein L29 [Candidatus Pacearchaeota archaeon]|nr:50S ribosomal protein L29 [Candidatus Pacearchaeota archaeon]